MPLLEDFDFVAHKLATTTEDIDLQLTSQRFPRLQVLSLCGIVSPQDVHLYAQLRMLSLYGCSHSLSFDHFLNALAASTRLEKLSLTAALHHFPDDWMRSRARRAPISLPSLRELTLEEHGMVRTSLFLSHLQLHPSVALMIDGSFKEIDYVDDSPDTVNSISAMLPPDPKTTFHALSIVTTVNVTVGADEYEISCGTLKRKAKKDVPNAIFTLSRRGGHGWDRFMAQGLDDLVASFRRSPLTRLHVYGDHQHGTVTAWTRVFRTFPLLEELQVRGEPDVSVETVFLGLHAASAAVIQTDSGPPVTCPNLKTVNVEGKKTVQTYEVVLNCFRYRAGEEAVLETLNLGFALHTNNMPSGTRRAYARACARS